MPLLAFRTLPLKKQELVGNQCMSCPPIKSSVNVTGGSPGREKGAAGSRRRSHLWGPLENFVLLSRTHAPRAQEAGAPWKVLVVVFPGMVFISLVFLFFYFYSFIFFFGLVLVWLGLVWFFLLAGGIAYI